MSGDEQKRAARQVVDQMLAERGPIPDHQLQRIAKVMRRATPKTQAPAKKPA